MDWVVIGGVLGLGILIGLLVGWYLNEVSKMTEAVVASAIAMLSGSGVISVFHFLAPGGPTREYWFYPIGLLIGVLSAAPTDVYFNSLYRTKKKAIAEKKANVKAGER